METSPEPLTTFFAGCLRPLLILIGDPSSALMYALRGEASLFTLMVEAVVTVVEGRLMPRLRFRKDADDKTSSMSDSCCESTEDSEELSSFGSSSSLTGKRSASLVAKACIDAAKDLVCRRDTISAFSLIFAVSRAIREVFMRGLHCCWC